jgi:ketosteroid isomerase-like protein
MMLTDAKTVATTYFSAWKERDFEKLRSVLADEVTFSGPMGAADGADECLMGLQGMAKDMDDINIQVIVAEGSDVITWYELHMRGAEPLPTANWSHIEDGKITSIRATFDPRPMMAASKK